MPARKKHTKKSRDYWFVKFLALSTVLFGLIWLFLIKPQNQPPKPVDTTPWKLYESKDGGYSLNYPDNWGSSNINLKVLGPKDRVNLVSETGFSKVYFDQPGFGKDSGETPSGDPILTVKIVGKKSLIKTVDQAIGSLPHGGPDISLKDERIRKVGGLDAILLITDTVFADPKISSYAYFFVNNGKLYTYSYISPSGDPLPVPEAILSSFSFTK